MMPGQMYRNIQKGQKISDSSIERLARRLVPSTIEELVRVCEADSKGRGLPEIDRTGEYKPGAWLVAKAEELGVYREQPEKLITGKDLIKEGFSPGKDFREIIDIGIKLRTFQNMLRKLEQGTEATNYTKEEALHLVAGLGDTLEAIEALKGHTIQTINNIRKIRNSQRENKK
jgi:hypothetical protein